MENIVAECPSFSKGLTTTMQVCGSGDTKAFEFGFLFLFFPKEAWSLNFLMKSTDFKSC